MAKRTSKQKLKRAGLNLLSEINKLELSGRIVPTSYKNRVNRMVSGDYKDYNAAWDRYQNSNISVTKLRKSAYNGIMITDLRGGTNSKYHQLDVPLIFKQKGDESKSMTLARAINRGLKRNMKKGIGGGTNLAQMLDTLQSHFAMNYGVQILKPLGDVRKLKNKVNNVTLFNPREINKTTINLPLLDVLAKNNEDITGLLKLVARTSSATPSGTKTMYKISAAKTTATHLSRIGVTDPNNILENLLNNSHFWHTIMKVGFDSDQPTNASSDYIRNTVARPLSISLLGQPRNTLSESELEFVNEAIDELNKIIANEDGIGFEIWLQDIVNPPTE